MGHAVLTALALAMASCASGPLPSVDGESGTLRRREALADAALAEGREVDAGRQLAWLIDRWTGLPSGGEPGALDRLRANWARVALPSRVLAIEDLVVDARVAGDADAVRRLTEWLAEERASPAGAAARARSAATMTSYTLSMCGSEVGRPEPVTAGEFARRLAARDGAALHGRLLVEGADGIDELLPLLVAADPDIRRRAWTAFAKVGPAFGTAVIAPLIAAAPSLNVAEHECAGRVIAAVGPAGRSSMRDALRDPDPSVRGLALNALAGEEPADDALFQAAADHAGDGIARTAALRILRGRRAVAADAATLLRAARLLEARRRGDGQALAQTIAALGSAALPVVSRALDEHPSDAFLGELVLQLGSPSPLALRACFAERARQSWGCGWGGWSLRPDAPQRSGTTMVAARASVPFLLARIGFGEEAELLLALEYLTAAEVPPDARARAWRAALRRATVESGDGYDPWDAALIDAVTWALPAEAWFARDFRGRSVAELLVHDDDHVRAAALIATARDAPRYAESEVRRCLTDRSSVVRCVAVQASMRVRCLDEAAACLDEAAALALLADGDDAVARLAVGALFFAARSFPHADEMSDPVVDALTAAVQRLARHGDWTARCAIAADVDRRRAPDDASPSAFDAILAELPDDVAATRLAAVVRSVGRRPLSDAAATRLRSLAHHGLDDTRLEAACAVLAHVGDGEPLALAMDAVGDRVALAVRREILSRAAPTPELLRRLLGYDDAERVRDYGFAVGRHPHTRASDAEVLAAYERWRDRDAAVAATLLQTLADPAAIPADALRSMVRLLRGAADTETDGVVRAIGVLSRVRPAGVVRLADVIGDTGVSPAVRRACMEGLARIGEAGRPAARALLGILEGDRDARWPALLALAAIGVDGADVPRVVALLRDRMLSRGSEELRCVVACLVRSSAADQAVPELAAYLPEDGHVLEALVAAGDVGVRAVIDAFGPAVKAAPPADTAPRDPEDARRDRDRWRMRLASARHALLLLDHPEAVRLVRESIERDLVSRDRYDRATALAVVANDRSLRLARDSDRWLPEMLRDEYSSVRLRAVQVVGRLAAPDAVERVMPLLDDAEAGVVEAALAVVVSRGPAARAALPRLEAMADRPRDGAAAMSALLDLGADAGVVALHLPAQLASFVRLAPHAECHDVGPGSLRSRIRLAIEVACRLGPRAADAAPALVALVDRWGNGDSDGFGPHRALAKVGPTDASVRLLAELVARPDCGPLARTRAAELLAGYEDAARPAIDALRAGRAHASGWARAALDRALRTLGGDDVDAAGSGR